MDPKEMTRRVLRELAAERASHGHGEAERIDRRMHKSKGYLGRLIRGDLGLHVETLFEALEALDVDAADFFTRVVGTRVCPERLLRRLERQSERGARSVLDGFTIEIFPEVAEGRRFEVQLGFEDPPEVEDVEGQLEKFDEELFSFPERALRSAERSVLACAFRLSEDQSDANVALACRALGALGTAYRVRSDFGLAARGLGLGLRLCSNLGLPAVRAELLLRVCYLVGDHGEYELAIDLARRAADAYLLLQDRIGLGKAFVVRAVMHNLAGHLDAAVESYLLGLDHLPESLWIGRWSCFQGLGRIYAEEGRFGDARDAIAQAVETHRTGVGQNWWRLVWLKGDIALATGELDSARRLFREARNGFVALEQPLDAALVSLRLAKSLLMTGRNAEIRALASEMMSFLGPRKKHRFAEAAIYEFSCAALTGDLTVDVIDSIYKKLASSTVRQSCGWRVAVSRRVEVPSPAGRK